MVTLFMRKTKFTESQTEDIEEALGMEGLRNLPRKKLTALLMICKGLTQADAAKVVDVNERTVRGYCRELREGGIASIVEDRQYRPSSALEPFYERISESLKQQPPSTSREAAVRMSALTGLNVCPSHARTLMKRLGFKCLMPGSAPGKANVGEQLDFFEQSLRPKLEEAKAGKRKVFFVDAAHFVRGPYLRRVWSFERLWIRTASGKGRLSVMGALDACADSIRFLATEENIDSVGAACILYKLRESHPDEPITVVVDNARYQACHRYKSLARALNVELLFLPAYSPNLNLIERVWKWIKGQCLYNKYYAKINEFHEAILDCLERIEKQMPQTLKSMLTLNFQFQNHTGNL